MRLVELRAGTKASLSRALTGLETAAGSPAVAELLDSAWGQPQGVAIGLTGPPGVGKSSLAHALIPALRGLGRSVAILAVDPSSRQSGGALLGDRARVSHDPADRGVFFRSMAARDRLGGVAEVTFPALVLMRALFDLVLVETVGIGQSETEVAELADLTVFCAQPGSGDALQYMKAGVMEVPDLVLVTKGDMGVLAQRTATDLAGALSLASAAAPPVLVLSALTGEGVGAAVAAMLSRSGEDFAARRARQAMGWIAGQIRIDFGRFGLEKVADQLAAPSGTPFSHHAAVSRQMRDLLDFRAVSV